MFNGIVTFRAWIKGNRLTFPLCQFDPKTPGVDKVEMESKVGNEILTTVHLVSIATHEEGAAIATKVNTVALNRISFLYDIVIADGEMIDAHFSPLNPAPGHSASLGAAHLSITFSPIEFTRGVTAATLRAQLEQGSLPGEDRFGFYRSARRSMSPVEEFMHLYNILLMLHDDDQSKIDAFIVGEDPTVLQTQSPVRKPGVMETVYTRLRNELGHSRAGVNSDDTKAEMAKRLGDLIALTKRAISSCP